MIDKNIKASIVWDDRTLTIPADMGSPSPNQMQGTEHEKLSELCCRTCYDSLGRGRSSPEMHDHLLDVKHWSVYEHVHFTIGIDIGDNWAEEYDKLLTLAGRPGMVILKDKDVLRITSNYRHLLDWDRWTKRLGKPTQASDELFNILLVRARTLAPKIVQRLEFKKDAKWDVGWVALEPNLVDEKFVTIYLSGSRGFSHEMVRHRFNISQRSTRYCDESSSPWVEHPLISQYIHDEAVPFEHRDEITARASSTITEARQTYDCCIQRLESYLVGKGVDKQTARKQARGAARGYLGNALCTELMFSASVTDWRDMLELRHSKPADAEIRCLFEPVLASLKASRYGAHFDDMKSVPSPDGIGTVLHKE